MIYYLVQSYSDESLADNYITSKACINRVNYISNLLSEIDDVTIVCTTLPVSNYTSNSRIRSLTNKIRVYYPSVGGSKINIVNDCAAYIKNNICCNDLLICYNAHFLSAVIIKKVFNALKKKNVDIVCEIEELYSKSSYYSGFKKIALSFCEKFVQKKASGSFLACDNLFTKYLQGKPFIVSNGYCVGNLITTDYNSDIPLVLYCGRLDEDSGIEDLLSAIKYINFECKIIVCGGGEKEPLLNQFLCNNSNVDFSYKGFVPQDKLDEYLSTSSVCLSTLKTNRQFSKFSFPSKIIEYLSFGNIVVSSNIDSIKHLKKYFPEQIYSYTSGDGYELACSIENGIKNNFKSSRIKNVKTFKAYFEIKNQEFKSFITTFIKK